jgi:catechol 2,3-dioxygenase-like lactoylglutathione lyase family enzyme
MNINHVTIRVDSQDKALWFYTSLLGFTKGNDFSIGGVRWLTVAAAESRNGGQLVLEPNHLSPSAAAQKILYDAEFPAAVLSSADLIADYDRLRGHGVSFRSAPRRVGPVLAALLDDTCGNNIMMVQGLPDR